VALRRFRMKLAPGVYRCSAPTATSRGRAGMEAKLVVTAAEGPGR